MHFVWRLSIAQILGGRSRAACCFGADAGDRLFGMAKKKVTLKKKSGGKKKAKKAAPLKKKVAAKKVVRATAKKSVTKKSAARKVRGITEEIQSPMKSSLGGNFGVERQRPGRGMGAAAGGQSGDTEGISRDENDDSESVEELLEEGQSYEAEAVSGVENARDADQGEVRTHEIPQDDVPDEYGGEN